MNATPHADLHLERHGHVAIVEMRRPPHNFFDLRLIAGLADVLEALQQDADCRAIVLAAQGSAFCAGAHFDSAGTTRRAAQQLEGGGALNPLYVEALRIFATTKPIVAAVQGPAIGGGLGLALVADFRVSCPEARFSANFTRLGFHPGFGLSATLPRLIGEQQAALLFYTGRRIDGQAARAIGLIDQLVEDAAAVRAAAMALAEEIATSAPLAVQSTRATLRAALLPALRNAVARESAEQAQQFHTEDFREGVEAMTERRLPRFAGR